MISRIRDERGMAVTVWAILLVAVVTLLMGITVDLSGQVAAKRQADDLAAEAARVAAEQVNAVAYLNDGRSTELVAAQARTAAVTYLQLAGAQGVVRFDGPTTLVVNVTYPYRPVFLGSFGARFTVTGTATTRLVRVQNGSER